VPIAALITAQDQTDLGDGLRATLPIAGRSLLEVQAAIARRAGASHIVLLVERVPAALAQAIDRLKRQGAKIAVARSVPDAAALFEPDEHILLIADGCVAGQATVDRLLASTTPSVLVLPDTQDYADFERIDADARWAGFAVIDAAALSETAEMLGDWDLSSTLLRRLLQQDAARIDALVAQGPEETPPIIAMGAAAIGALEAHMMQRAGPDLGDWVQRYLHRLVTAPLIGPLVARKVDRRHVALAAVGLGWAGAAFALFGLFWPAVLLLPLAAALASAERRMARIWSDRQAPALPFTAARYLAAMCVLTMIARSIAADGGWGWWLVATLVPASLTALWAFRPIGKALDVEHAPLWRASADALAWIAPVLAVLVDWRWMVLALAFYAFLSFLSSFAAVRSRALARKARGV